MAAGRTTLLAAGTTIALAFAVLLVSATGAQALNTMTLKGTAAPGTPAKYNKVGVLRQGPKKAKKILVLAPGTSAGATNFRSGSEQWHFCQRHQA